MQRMILFLAAIVFASVARAEDIPPEQLKFFEAKIRPVLIRECYGCHSNKSGNVRGGLRLDTKELMHIGGSAGPAIVPGNPDESWLYNAITHQDFVMPPKRKLPDNVIADFRKWIEMGAPDPRTTNQGEIKSSISPDDIQQARETFWAYKKPVKHPAPKPKDSAWSDSAIDRFVLAKLDDAGLKPSPDADPDKVLRRLCFDLVGLPPSPKQLTQFSSLWKTNPQRAIARVVDNLLQREQFGERWGRHWLDVVRYAESTGSQVNMTYPHAWRYRDYVIDSMNADKPFDRFVQEQIAGDLLPVDSDEEWASNLIATSFLAIGPKNVNEQNRVQFAANVADEQIDATTRVFLGMSVACARCHDHKFDAIPQTDYYALAGIFKNMTTYFGNPPSDLGSFSSAQTKQTSSLILLPVDDPNPFDKTYSSSELSDLRDQITSVQQEMRESRRNRSGDAGNAQRQRLRQINELTRLNNKLSVVDENGQPRTYCMGVQETGRPQNSQLLVRGEIDQRAQVVERGFPQVLCSTDVSIDEQQSGRLQLARWIGSDQNTLTARVMVNRIWQHLLGYGLVRSTENFGVTGQAPSHPELLDYLAVQFVENGWSIKSLIREIVASRVYRQSSQFNRKYHEFDPDNALLWRANPRRLDAEAIRDAMLAVSGEIDLSRPRGSLVAEAGYLRVQNGVLGNPRDIARQAFGNMNRNPGSTSGNGAGRFQQRNGSGRPGMNRQGAAGRGGSNQSFRSRRGLFGANRGRNMQDMRANYESAVRKVTHQLDMEDAKFRSVYLPIVRDEEPRSLNVFDYTDSSSIVGTRESSHTANQALYMMNNPFVLQQSQAFAARIAEKHRQPVEQVDEAFLLAYGRKPTTSERSAALRFARKFAPTVESDAPGKVTLTALCQSLFASAEFRFID